ncbi:Tyrosine-protein kinase receptor [Aphelenchoides fujianensis]|nr:Tyrosine-protein kinase receptor [Aphelenchoides fujianensis]
MPVRHAAAFPLLFLLLFPACLATISSSSSQQCQLQCVDRNIAFPLSAYELTWPNETLSAECDFDCRIESCRLGCADLDENSNCEAHCDGAKSRASCQQACRAIADVFLNQIQRLINQVAVEADLDLTQGILLNWSFDQTHEQTLKEALAANLRWFAQISSTNTGWRSTALNSLRSEVRFRLAAAWRNTIITSPNFHQTFPTLPAVPTAPTLLSGLQITANSYALCWLSERQPAGDKTSKYRLVLKSKSDEEPLRALETQANCHLFRQLPAEDCCNVLIEDISDGDHSTASLKVAIEMRPSTVEESEKPKMMVTNGTVLLRVDDLNDYAMLSEPTTIPFLVPAGQSITALTTISSTELLIGLSDGSIQYADISGENSTTIQRELRAADGSAIAQLAVDHVQKFVYAVREQKGIIRCGLRDCQQPTRVETGSLQFISTIALDSWNGNIYYATDKGDTFSTPLFPPNAPEVYALSITRRLAEIPPATTLEVDEAEQRLIVVLRNGTLMSFDLVDRTIRNERENVDVSDSYQQVVRSASLNGRLFWISTNCGDDEPAGEPPEAKAEGISTTSATTPESSTAASPLSAPKKPQHSCLKSEETDPETHAVHLNTYIGGFGTHFHDFALLRDPPRPLRMRPVERVSLLMSNLKGRVTWRPPAPMPFQASSNWRLLHYECRVSVVNAEGTREISNGTGLNSTDFSFAAESGQSYAAAVRVRRRRGRWANVTNSAFPVEQLDRLVVYVKTPDLAFQPNDILGEEIHDARVPVVSEYLSRYVEDHGLKMLERNAIVAFDSFSRLLYLGGPQNGAILQFGMNGVYSRLFDFLAVQHMTLMPRLAVLFVASSYQIAAYRMTSSFQKTLYNCVEENCPSVVGLAADDSSGTLFYMLQNANGTMELHSLKINGEENTAQLLAITDKLPAIRQIATMSGRLALVTADGLVGTCDQRLNNLNLNFGIKDVQFLLPLTDGTEKVPDAARFSFDHEIEFVQTEKTQLMWSLQPPLAIQLFQDGFGGERTVDLSLTPEYTLPSAVLQKWNSKQKFDVQVDVITPWLTISTNKTTLTAPTKPPSAPTNLKIYVTQQKTVDGTRAMIDLFWDAPVEWNGEMAGYAVNCNVIDEQESMKPIASANLTARHSRAFYFSATSGRVQCVVAARNEHNLLGAFSDPVTIDSSEFRPLVRLFAIDSVGELLGIYNWSSAAVTPTASPVELMKLQRRRRRRRQSGQPQYHSVAFICNELYAIRKEPDLSQPSLVLLDINDVQNVLHKVVVNGDFSQISAMTSDWIANRLLLVGNQELLQISLENFQTQTAVVPKQLITLSVGAQDAKQLAFDPFTNTAYLLAKNGSLFSLNLNKQKEVNLGLHLDCLKSQTVTSIVGEFVWNKSTSPTLYCLTWNGMITIDPSTMKCSEVSIDWSQFGDDDASVQSMKPDSQQGLKSVTSFSVADKFFIFATATRLFIQDKFMGPITQIPIRNPPLKQILAASHSSQPYPDRQCFVLPAPSAINFTLRNEDRTGALIEVNDTNIQPAITCPGISFPQTQYEIFFKRHDSEKIKHVQSNQRNTHVENGILDKETDYDVYLSWYNRYYMPSGVSEIKHLRTGYGFPTAPNDPQAISLTPDTVLLYWKLPQTLNAPANEIKYKIKQSNQNTIQPVSIGAKQFINGNFSTDFSDIVGCLQNPCQAKISNLRPSSDYQFWVIAVHIQRMNPQLLPEDPAATSTEAKVRTKDLPGTFRFENATSDSLVLRFTSLEPETAPREVYVQYRESVLNRQSFVEVPWISVPNSTFDPLANPSVNVTIEGIRSATSYDFQFVALYSGNYEYDHEPKSFSEYYYQVPQQARTKAGAPDPPENVSLEEDMLGWYLKWTKPADNGGLPLTFYAIDFRKNSTSDWTIAERGLPADQQLRWRIDKNVISDLKHVEFRIRAYNAEGFGAYAYTENKKEKDEQSMSRDPLFWPLFATILLFLLIIFLCMAMYLIARSKRNKARELKQRIHKQIDLEQIGDLHFDWNYAKLPLEIRNEIQNLSVISKSQLEILEQLGNGSFGIVSRGILYDYDGKKTITVAIKQMKADHKTGTRSHFFKEAILMNNFDHPNIIRLLGVVNEVGEDQMLVMEFMPGGADFGMAREFHSSEYYRLNGEDLLPLRWLSPEAAMDGVFTSKSDVWAYGILLWEVLTLGDRPYNQWGNTRVLRELKEGDRPNPGRPRMCPDEIWEIVRRTWIKDVRIRPSFEDLLPDLEKLRGKPELQTMDPIRRREAFGFENDGFDNSTESGSERSDAHFDKSETKSRGGMNSGAFPLQLAASMRSRRRSNPHEQPAGSNEWSRNESAASGETFSTSVGNTTDYVTPRSTPTVGSSSRASDSNNGPWYRSAAYDHSGFVPDSPRVSDGNAHSYEMILATEPRFPPRPRPAPLPGLSSAPSRQPPHNSSPNRTGGARVSQV